MDSRVICATPILCLVLFLPPVLSCCYIPVCYIYHVVIYLFVLFILLYPVLFSHTVSCIGRTSLIISHPPPPPRRQVGKTAYGRILRMGFPLPSAEVVSTSMERAAADNVQWGLVDVMENRATGTAEVSLVGGGQGGMGGGGPRHGNRRGQ